MPSIRKGETLEEFRARSRAFQSTPEGRKYNADKNRKYWNTPEGRQRRIEYERRRSKSPKRVEWSLRRDLKRNYGISLEQYTQMLTAQDGKCAICGGINANGKRLFVDHNHKTGKVRALLCHKCNFAIGLVDENVARLLGIISYINKWNSTN